MRCITSHTHTHTHTQTHTHTHTHIYIYIYICIYICMRVCLCYLPNSCTAIELNEVSELTVKLYEYQVQFCRKHQESCRKIDAGITSFDCQIPQNV